MDETGVFARTAPGLDRPVQIGVAANRVISVSFPASVPTDAATDHPVIDALCAYLAGEGDTVSDIDVALTIPSDHRAVLEALTNVQHGDTVTVSQLLGLSRLDSDAHDTVVAALDANPVPILVPDHRVEGGAGATPAEVADYCRELET
jgi:methylated-DNA-[protein]-cysteine S-methyltransferase